MFFKMVSFYNSNDRSIFQGVCSMNDFFMSAWSFTLSQVIKTQDIHQGKVNPAVVSCLDSCDLALTQRQSLQV